MIQFSDISRKFECLDVPSVPFRYESIKSETGMNEKEAHAFWDEVFDLTSEVRAISEDDIQIDVYGR